MAGQHLRRLGVSTGRLAAKATAEYRIRAGIATSRHAVAAVEELRVLEAGAGSSSSRSLSYWRTSSSAGEASSRAEEAAQPLQKRSLSTKHVEKWYRPRQKKKKEKEDASQNQWAAKLNEENCSSQGSESQQRPDENASVQTSATSMTMSKDEIAVGERSTSRKPGWAQGKAEWQDHSSEWATTAASKPTSAIENSTAMSRDFDRDQTKDSKRRVEGTRKTGVPAVVLKAPSGKQGASYSRRGARYAKSKVSRSFSATDTRGSKASLEGRAVRGRVVNSRVVEDKCNAIVAQLDAGEFEAVAQSMESLFMSGYYFASPKINKLKFVNRAKLLLSDEALKSLLHLLHRTVQVCNDEISMHKPTGPGNAAASVSALTRGLALFPFYAVLTELIFRYWHHNASEYVQFLHNEIVLDQDKALVIDESLLEMLDFVCTVGSNPPFDKDMVLLGFSLLSSLKELQRQSRGKLAGDRKKATSRYNPLMRLCNRQFDRYEDPALLESVLQLFLELRGFGRPNTMSWVSLIFAHGRLGNVDAMFAHLAELQRSGCAPHVSIAEAIIAMCCRCGEVEKAEMVLQSMIHAVPWAPGVFYEPPLADHIHASVTGRPLAGNDYSAKANEEASKSSLLGRLLGRMRDAFTGRGGSTADHSSLVAHARDKVGRPVRHVWPEPTAFSYSMLMREYEERRNIDKVHELFTDMHVRNIESHPLTTVVIASAFMGSPYSEELLKLEMPDSIPGPFDLIQGRDLLTEGIFSDSESATKFRAQEQQQPQHQQQKSTGARRQFSNLLDLHNMSRPMANVSVLSHLEAIGNALEELVHLRNANGQDGERMVLESDDLFIIISGKGVKNRTRRGPILKEFVHDLLENKGIPHWVPADNEGRINVRLSDIYIHHRTRRKLEREIVTMRNSSFAAIGLLALASVPITATKIGVPFPLPWS